MEAVPAEGMIRLGAPMPLRQYLRELWSRRDFMIEVPLAEVRAKHLDTVLGNLWHLVNPALQMAVYYLIFGVVVRTDRGVDNFIAFLALGVLPFRWWTNTVQNGATAITANVGVIRALRFPRAVLPITATIESLLSFLPTVPVILVIAIVTGEVPSWRWIGVIPALIGLGLTGMGMTFIAARLTSKIADVKQVLPFVFRLLFYMSGVLYSVDEFVESETVRKAFALNPAYSVITVLRWSVLESPVRAEHMLSIVVWPLLVIPLGFSYFRRGEEDYGRV